MTTTYTNEQISDIANKLYNLAHKHKVVITEEQEKILAMSAYYSYLYAKNVLEAPWPLGEARIATDCEISYSYAFTVIKGRWIPGEASILKDLPCTLRYVCNILMAPWPEAEVTLSKNSAYIEAYYKKFPKKMSEEECILKIKELEEKLEHIKSKC
jgi:hypothetical protein